MTSTEASAPMKGEAPHQPTPSATPNTTDTPSSPPSNPNQPYPPQQQPQQAWYPQGYPVQPYPPHQQYGGPPPAYAGAPPPMQYGYAPQGYPQQPYPQQGVPIVVGAGQQPYYPNQPYQQFNVAAMVGHTGVQYTPTFVRTMFVGALIALVLAAVMIGAPGWYKDDNRSANMGLFTLCLDAGGGSISCYGVCNSDNSSTQCNRVRALRAYVILGAVVLVIYSILRLLAVCAGTTTLPSKLRRRLQVLCTFAGVVCYAVSIGIAGSAFKDYAKGFGPDFCFFFCIANIGVNFIFFVNDYRLLSMP